MAGESDSSALLPVYDRTWQQKLIDQLNNYPDPTKVVMCTTSPSHLNVALNGITKYAQLSVMKNALITNQHNQLVLDKNKMVIRPKNFVCKDTNMIKKISYVIGLKRLGGVRLCYYWDKCEVKMCKSKIGKFLVYEGEFEMRLIDIMSTLMGNYFQETKRQEEADQIIIGDGNNYVNVPKEDDVANRKMFMNKFFVLKHGNNAANISEADFESGRMELDPMSPKQFKEIFELYEDKNVSKSSTFIVASALKDVTESLSGEIETFALNLLPIMFIYIDKSE
ncbi:DNA binding protein [Epinotia aporema granulovirus]|uniref:DNA binding protein n=1 Tax=Epinotia aporema granulovirus TaxID=166056 RepID=K4EQT6_9BBAC|nr:DNA binding protein [Epinotia aporema granulovirus]AER41501.1 DNA binding protein [Epinotia aporema granulovirus]